MADFTVQIWAAVIPAIGTLAAVAINAHVGTLRRVERLTEIATSMRSSSERQLIEDLRDDYVTAWALQQMAPSLSMRRFAAVVTYSSASVLFFVWSISAIATKYDPITWWWYAATIVAALIGILLHANRFAVRARWAREERARRWMRRPVHVRLRDQLNEDD